MIDAELFISVDIESSGPIPGEFSLLSIGAVSVDQPQVSFYIELQPDSLKHDPESLAVTGFDIAQLARTGIEPREAMQRFSGWLSEVSALGQKPIFLGLNAPFDWSFVNYYFYKYCGSNPFGFAALDLKAYYMGVEGIRWDETKSSRMARTLGPALSATHNALDDARYQAELFRLMRKRRILQG
ncbi:exonuclease domain-containing protein [Xanthomonas hydrangeae]|uniref:Exonuclease domain-containing protein n=1 Tax=Xanthomonas hydrangeae TaxID=2775159 RepID=A0AAU0BEU0_9XANT|nr:exonuclease domain-containing protein [Xanthomonas hydrangeae]WOB51311.1 exonuclease domain-containing protein [Xanthomonas hydrangeae]